ncbi:MAG: DUF4158 domain-containing protein [Verrucomicrobia bacterium]|nr:DUF4158 domain-containing protein [Verrucomicrobiota bacterium]
MDILNAVEREAFDSPPVFNSFQRKQYFDFPSKLRRFAADLRSPAYRVGFLLSAGYFKAVKRFFSPGAFHRRDIEYVTRQLELGVPMVDLASYHPRARQRHQFTIRTFYGFRAFDLAACRLCSKRSPSWCGPKSNLRSSSGAVSMFWFVKDGGVDKSTPVGFLDSEERVAVSKEGKFRVSLYKALLFLHVQNGIKSGALNLEHSYKYRPLSDYLLNRDRCSTINSSLSSAPSLRPSSIPTTCSGSSTRPCTSSILRPTSTLPSRRIPTSNSRRTAASPSPRPSRKRATRSLYSNSSPGAASCP